MYKDRRELEIEVNTLKGLYEIERKFREKYEPLIQAIKVIATEVAEDLIYLEKNEF